MPPARYANTPIIQISNTYHHINGRAIRSIQLKAILFISTVQIELLMLRLIAIAIVIKPIVSIAPRSEVITANIQETMATNLMSELSKLLER